MKEKIFNNKNRLIFLISSLILLIVLYIILIFINYSSLKKYDNLILKNVYVEQFDMSDYSYKRAKAKLEFYNEYLLNKVVVFKINSSEYKYTLKDLGFNIDYKRTFNEIKKYQDNLSVSKKLMIINSNEKIKFDVYYSVNDDGLVNSLNSIKSIVDVSAVDGYFDTSNGVKYVSGGDGFYLNVDMSKEIIKDYFLKAVDKEINIELVGDSVKSNTNESYASIDTMTSSFTTTFNAGITQRATNLRSALNYINGAIVEPGEVFSYYKYAGPYNKAGYVFYYEFVGNGVCQIATTVYDAALLGGLEIVKRYPHAKKSVYVDGGLDATVASYSSGWNIDMQWKNTYKYPIYIKAYAVGGEAHVEFWSNSNAKEGKTYSTESVWLGGRGYTTYLHTYKDGVEIDKSKIATTWYIED